jgi:hypothetical protein
LVWDSIADVHLSSEFQDEKWGVKLNLPDMPPKSKPVAVSCNIFPPDDSIQNLRLASQSQIEIVCKWFAD